MYSTTSSAHGIANPRQPLRSLTTRLAAHRSTGILPVPFRLAKRLSATPPTSEVDQVATRPCVVSLLRESSCAVSQCPTAVQHNETYFALLHCCTAKTSVPLCGNWKITRLWTNNQTPPSSQHLGNARHRHRVTPVRVRLHRALKRLRTPREASAPR